MASPEEADKVRVNAGPRTKDAPVDFPEVAVRTRCLVALVAAPAPSGSALAPAAAGSVLFTVPAGSAPVPAPAGSSADSVLFLLQCP